MQVTDLYLTNLHDNESGEVKTVKEIFTSSGVGSTSHSLGNSQNSVANTTTITLLKDGVKESDTTFSTPKGDKGDKGSDADISKLTLTTTSDTAAKTITIVLKDAGKDLSTTTVDISAMFTP